MTSGNRLDLLENGDAIFPAMLAAAAKEIWIANSYFLPDDATATDDVPPEDDGRGRGLLHGGIGETSTTGPSI